MRSPALITSDSLDERLSPFYQRVGVHAGLLESLAGISERRECPEGVSFMDAAAMAGEKAPADFDRSEIGQIGVSAGDFWRRMPPPIDEKPSSISSPTFPSTHNIHRPNHSTRLPPALSS